MSRGEWPLRLASTPAIPMATRPNNGAPRSRWEFSNEYGRAPLDPNRGTQGLGFTIDDGNSSRGLATKQTNIKNFVVVDCTLAQLPIEAKYSNT